MNTLMITETKNGYILTLLDSDSNELDARVAGKNNPRGYSSIDLVTVIEDIFADNKPVPAPKLPANLPTSLSVPDSCWTLPKAIAEAIKEDSDKAAY